MGKAPSCNKITSKSTVRLDTSIGVLVCWFGILLCKKKGIILKRHHHHTPLSAKTMNKFRKTLGAFLKAPVKEILQTEHKTFTGKPLILSISLQFNWLALPHSIFFSIHKCSRSVLTNTLQAKCVERQKKKNQT